MPSDDQAALDDASARQELAVGVQQQDAHHDADAERQDDDHEVLGLRARGVSVAKPGPEDAEHADQRRGDAEVEQRPADRAVLADERDAFAQLARASSPPPARRRRPRAGAPCAVRGGRRRRRQREAEARRDEVERRDEQDQGLRRRRCSRRAGRAARSPSAKAALSVSVKMPFAASSWLRGTSSGIIAASAGAKNTVTVETKMFSSRISRRLSPTRNSAMNASPRSRLVAIEDQRRSMPVDVDAGDGREQDRRHEERQDQQADGGVRLGARATMTVRPIDDHVAADLGRGLGQPEAAGTGGCGRRRGRAAPVAAGRACRRRAARPRRGISADADLVRDGGATRELASERPVTGPGGRGSTARRRPPR